MKDEKGIDIKFTKWKVELAEGFEWIKEKHCKPYIKMESVYYWDMCNKTFAHSLYSPLLSQRAIEGVNNIRGKFHIVINAETVFVMIDDSLDPINHRYFDYSVPPDKSPIEQSKESALKYIFDQENK